MSVGNKNFITGHYYHVFNRGVNKNNIFYSDDNYLFCLRQVKKYSLQSKIKIIAYCLMPNHYHFLLRQDGRKSISSFIQVLFNSYVQALNKQIDRKGTLFESRFKRIEIQEEKYLLYLCRYIHTNPVQAGLVLKPEQWPFSNYLEWIGRRDGILQDRFLIDSYFPSRKEYIAFIQTELELNEDIMQYYIESNGR